MARLPRLGIPSILQHVIQRGNNRQACFYADDDRRFCPVLMTNHAHVLMTPTSATGIGRVMQTLGRRYVRYETSHPSAPTRMSWARLLKRVFEFDIEQCPQCGGALKIIGAIEHPPVIAKILAHLGLPARAPPRSPARLFDRLQIA